MNEEARILLKQIGDAEQELTRLKAEYRKVCRCNVKRPGMENKPDNSSVAYKIYETCNYHEVKVYR
jgi:predicted TIM-barrel fold metal-dependent hydrolase